MESYNIVRDELISTWRRNYYTVEASSVDEAIKMIENEEVDCTESELLYDFEQLLHPDQMKQATVEYYLDDELIETNY